MSLYFKIGDFPAFVIVIVAAPWSRAIWSASIMSFDEPEWDYESVKDVLMK